MTTDIRRGLEGQVRTEVCAQCGANLLVAYWQGEYVLRCGACNQYEPDTRPRYEPSLTRRYRAAGSLAAAGFTAIEAQTLTKQLRKRIRNGEAEGRADAQAIALLEKLEAEMNGSNRALTPYQDRSTALVDPQEAVRYLDFSGVANAQQVQAAALDLIERTRLNPMLGEIMIYEKRLYVTVQGIGHLVGPLLDGVDPPRFWSREEKQNAGYDTDDVVCSVTIYRKGASRGITGTGRASRDPDKSLRPKNPVEPKFPQRFAENRALRHAYRLGFQDLLTRYGADLLPDAAAEEQDEQGLLILPQSVDVSTGEIGEIIEGEANLIQEDHEQPAETPPPAAPDQSASGKPRPSAQHKAAPSTPYASTAGQRRAIFAKARQAGMTDEDLRTRLQSVYNVDSTKILTLEQAADLLNYLERRIAQEAVPADEEEDDAGRPFI